MTKSIKTILMVIGLGLLAYGIYTIIMPEAQISIGDLDLVKAQDNTNAFIITGLGLVVILIGFLGGKK